MARLANEFNADWGDEFVDARLHSGRLHKLHCQSLLVRAEALDGRTADCASDGLLVRNKHGQWTLVTYEGAKTPDGAGKGLGGELVVWVPDHPADEQFVVQNVNDRPPRGRCRGSPGRVS